MGDTVYEGMFLLDSNRYGRDPEAVSGQIPRVIEEAGGEMLVSRLWDERRLAYPIKGHRKGTYWLTYFRLGGEQLGGVRRQFQLNDSILRFLVLKIDPRIVETLVEHAKSATVASAADVVEGQAPARGPSEKAGQHGKEGGEHSESNSDD